MTNGTVLEGLNGIYKINISINAQAEIEELLGKSMFSIMNEVISIKVMRVIFSVGLRYGEGKKVNYEEAGEVMDDIITKHSYEYLNEKIQTELTRAYGGDKESTETENREEGNEGK